MPPTERTPAESPYSFSRVLASLKHLLMGKALSTLGGIGALFLIVRGMPIPDFAAYSIMFGLVEVLAVVTSVGTGQIMTRYVPELFMLDYRAGIGRLVWRLSVVRIGILAGVLIAAACFIEPMAKWFDLEAWREPLMVYLLVVLFRTASTTFFQVLEAMLHQGQGQGAFAAITVLRFIGVAILYALGNLGLMALVVVEVLAEATGLALMAWHLRRALTVADGGAAGAADVTGMTGLNGGGTGGTVAVDVDAAVEVDPPEVSREVQYGWLRENRRRMLVHGIKGYFQHMVSMPFSGVVNRLVVGGARVAAPEAALFGFAQSILDLMERYLPAQLFQGLIRPVMVARWSSTGQIDEPALLTNTSLKVNLVLVGGFAAVLLAGNEQMLLALTNGKYGERALWMLLLMCLLVALDSWRHVLDQLSQTVERYGFMTISNAVLGLSLLGGVALLPWLGVAGLPIANCIGALAANLMVRWWLQKSGIAFRHDLRGIARILLATLVAMVAARLSMGWFAEWWWRVAAAALVAAACMAVALRTDDGIARTWQALKERRRQA